MKNIFQIVLILSTMIGYAQNFNKEERKLIASGDKSTMLRVIETTNEKESRILKSVSKDIDPKEDLLQLLAERMFLAMRDPKNPGIGIAAPQVGINRNVFWVRRFDKEGEPFEFYINPKITWRSELLRKGLEGCLSIPEIRGEVLRNYAIKVAYTDQKGSKKEEIVEGFTAVVFQHEFDHLNGILFTDRLEEQQEMNIISANTQSNLFIVQKN